MSLVQIALAILSVVVIVLAYAQWNDYKKLSSIDEALAKVADAAVAKFQEQIQSYTAQQIELMDKQIKEQANSLGLSVDTVETASKTATATQQRMQSILDQIRKTTQDNQTAIQQKADQVLSQVQLDLQTAQNNFDSFDQQLHDKLVAYIQQLSDKYAQQDQQSTTSMQQAAGDAQTAIQSQYKQSLSMLDDKIAKALQAIQDIGTATSGSVTSLQQQAQTSIMASSDSAAKALASSSDAAAKALTLQADTASKSLATSADATLTQLKQSSDSVLQSFKDQTSQYYAKQLPLFIAQLQQSLQDVITQTQAQMVSIMYKYGYRRQISGIVVNVGKIDSSSASGALPLTSFKGLASVSKTVTSGLTTFTCNMAVAVPFDYDVFYTVYANKAAFTTMENDTSSFARVMSPTQFAIGIENNYNSSNDNSIAVTLIEK